MKAEHSRYLKLVQIEKKMTKIWQTFQIHLQKWWSFNDNIEEDFHQADSDDVAEMLSNIEFIRQKCSKTLDSWFALEKKIVRRILTN